MTSQSPYKNLSLVVGGLCFAVMSLLLVIAYVPEFRPTSYSNLRRSGLIMLVPMIAGIGLISSVGWLWWEHKLEEKRKSEDAN